MEEEKLHLLIKKKIFSNPDTLYGVYRTVKKEDYKEVIIVGPLAELEEGEEVLVTGRWNVNRTYGEQFYVNSYQRIEPTTEKGIVRYLSSRLIKGIGPVLAEEIVKTFGKDTIEIIKNNPERLLEVPGIGRRKLETIKKSIEKNTALEKVMIFLRSHDISETFAAKIYKKYGEDAISVIKTNPYQLIRDIDGIGFKKADILARKAGVPENSPERIKAAIIYLLEEEQNSGHLYQEKEALFEEVKRLIDVPNESLEQCLDDLVNEFELVKHIHEDKELIYLKKAFNAEKSIARKLYLLSISSSTKEKIKQRVIVDKLSYFLNEHELNLDDTQKQAIMSTVENKISVITGGPGTGKTTIIRVLTDFLTINDISYCLCAPTGRAAKRLQESTGKEAKTIHRLLKFEAGTGKFKKDRYDPLECSFLIVDEASMIDTYLMASLLDAVKPSTYLVFIGDIDQLPPVGPGNVLRDLIDCGFFNVKKLEKIYRQAKDSLIIHNAHRINKGLSLVEKDPADSGLSDFYFIEKNNPETILNVIIELITKRIPQTFRFDPLRDIQVITPMYKGVLGLDNLNFTIQQTLNPLEDERNGAKVKFRVNDKVMQNVNNYDKEVYNGDIGIVEEVHDEYLTVNFGERIVRYERSEYDELTLAYAISVHKSQGSEFPCVIIVIHTQHYIMLRRNLLYTALTRGKKLVCLVGNKKALGIAIKNNPAIERRTLLKEFVSQLFAAG